MKVPEKFAGGTFIPCPEGTHLAVCVDFVELKDVQRAYGGEAWTEDQGRFTFQVNKQISASDLNGATDKEAAKKLIGQRFSVRTFGMKMSMHENAKMRKFLESFEGRAFKVNEDVDPEGFVGRACMLLVVHKKGGDDGTKVYANIAGVMPLPDGVPGIAPENYVREKDRTEGATSDKKDDDSDIDFDTDSLT